MKFFERFFNLEASSTISARGSYIDGENVSGGGTVGGGGESSSGSYDIGPLGFNGLPDSEELDWIIVPRNIEIAEGSSGFAHTLLLASEETVFIIKKNDVAIGTVIFSDSSNAGVVSISSNISVSAGDRISISAPLIPDNTIENIQVVLLGNII